MSLRYPENDQDLQDIVRGETQYEDHDDALPTGDLEVAIERAKGRLELETGSDQWYSDDGLGFALAAYACMRAKAAVENVSLSSYNIGDEQVSFSNADPDTSQQLRQWADDVAAGLNASELDESQGPSPTNTSGYIGDTYKHDGPRRRRY